MAQEQSLPQGTGGASNRTLSHKQRAMARRRKAARKRALQRMRPPSPRMEHARTWGLRLCLALFAFLCGMFTLGNQIGERVVFAFVLGGVLLLLLWSSPSWGIVLSLLYVSLLGGIRRWLIPMFGFPPNDPLLLVAPFLVGAQFANLVLTRRLPRDTRLARTILWMLLIMFLEIFNPIQGGLSVGLGGVLFTIVPLLWYYYGRVLGSEVVLRRMMQAVVAISLGAALYGFYQTFVGLLPSEKQWVELNKVSYAALHISSTTIRAFSFFTSSQEYVQILGMGSVILWAAFLRGARQAIFLIPILGSAIFLSSTRGAVVITLIACIVLWAIQGRSMGAWAPRLAFALVLGFGGLLWSLKQVQTENVDKRAQALVNHQVEGLLKPGDEKSSTAGTHLNMVLSGIADGFVNPIGRGLGSTTQAGSKYDSSGQNGSTEIDISDAFSGLGFAGGLIYLCVVVLVLSTAVQWWQTTRSMPALMGVGMLVVHIGYWLHGGSYSAAMIIWFLIGGMERSLLSKRLAQAKTPGNTSAESVPGEPHSEEAAAAPEKLDPLRNTPRGRWLAGQKLLPQANRRTRW